MPPGLSSVTIVIFGALAEKPKPRKNLEKDRLHGVDEENSIAALRSPDPGTQNRRLSCVCRQAWPWVLSAPSLHLPHCPRQRCWGDQPLCVPSFAPLGPSLYSRHKT